MKRKNTERRTQNYICTIVRFARVRQIQGQSPEETGDVRCRVLRGFPRGDNAVDAVLLRTA
jgi:hypothetical protein